MTSTVALLTVSRLVWNLLQILRVALTFAVTADISSYPGFHLQHVKVDALK